MKKILNISKIFFKNLISFILFLPKLLTGLIIIAGIVFFLRFSSLDRPIDVEDGSALYIPMEGLIVEEKTSNTDLGDIFFQETNTPQIDLHQLLNAIEGAKNDDKILGIFIDLSDFLGGYPAELLKITNQLEDFKLSGKFIIAYSDFFSQSAYIIASPSTEIISYPSGGVLFQGFSSKRLFFKDFFDKIGLEVINLSEGQFKTAFENLTLSSMSEDDKNQRLNLFSNIWKEITDVIERNRELNLGSIDYFLNNIDQILEQNGGDWGKASVEYKLIDSLVKRGDLEKYFKKEYSKDENEWKHVDYRNYFKSKENNDEENTVAVVNILGPIIDGYQTSGAASGDNISALFDKALKNDQIKAMVVRVNTPGGSVFASELIRDALIRVKEKNIPIVTSMGGVAASGGYWVAASTDYIFAEDLTITGSIGVASVIFNAEGTFNKIGLNEDGVSSSVFSDTYRGIYSKRPDERLINLNKIIIQNIYDKFINLVSEGRNISIEDVNKLAKGQVWIGKDALKFNLIDEIGSLDDAIEKAASLAEIDEYNVKRIYKKKSRFSNFLPFLINEIGMKNEIINKNLDIEYRFEALFTNISNYNDPKALYYLCGTCLFIN
ncbi:MAG: signal peptide peptidase SppA [Hyphomicrobiales bacterium]|nr:signal peptide peptidase SppA [Hyphomicrobiales bacterium]